MPFLPKGPSNIYSVWEWNILAKGCSTQKPKWTTGPKPVTTATWVTWIESAPFWGKPAPVTADCFAKRSGTVGSSCGFNHICGRHIHVRVVDFRAAAGSIRFHLPQFVICLDSATLYRPVCGLKLGDRVRACSVSL